VPPEIDAVGLARELTARGLCIGDDFLSAGAITSLRACAAMRDGRGEFAAARIGPPGAAQRRAEIRGDSICWLTEPLFPAERQVLDCFESLRLACNREAQLGLFDLEMHYASFPPGAGYERHVDRPRGRGARTVSLALYLNEDWSGPLGGALRLFGGPAAWRDIEPAGGRLVAFLTDGLEHAVLPARRVRLSLSGWFRTRASD
jgi:SM-20-related protein